MTKEGSQFGRALSGGTGADGDEFKPIRHRGVFAPPSSLHLVEHFRKSLFEPQRLLDFLGCDIRIFPVLQKTRTLMITNELDERRQIGLPVCWKSLQVFKNLVPDPVLPVKMAPAVFMISVYLSKSVSKMPWHLK